MSGACENGRARWSQARIVILAVAFEGGLGVLAIGLGELIRVPPARTLDHDLRHFITGLIATGPLFALFILLARSRWRPLVRIRRLLVRFVGVFFGRCNWLDLAVVSIAAGVGEELLFRGLIQDGLARALGPTIALILTSIVFGLVHLITPLYGALATVMGAYLGIVWLASGSLTAVVVAHAFYDFVVLCWLHSLWRRQRRHDPLQTGPGRIA